MSDQKKWFKVWMSILTDPHFINLSCKQAGRWMRLGALLCQQGTDGKLVIRPPSLTYQEWFEVESFIDLVMCIKELPNVQIRPLENDNGEYIVIMLNWRKYQLDSTGYERLKRSRYKRREREDKTLTSKSTSSSLPAARVVATLDATQRPLAGERQTTGGLNHVGNEELRGKGILEQAAERARTLGLKKL